MMKYLKLKLIVIAFFGIMECFSQESIYTGKKSIYRFFIDMDKEFFIVEIRGPKYGDYDFLTKTIFQKENEGIVIIAKSERGILYKKKEKLYYKEENDLNLNVLLKSENVDEDIDYQRKYIFDLWLSNRIKKEGYNMEKLNYEKIFEAYQEYKKGQLKLNIYIGVDQFLEK